MYYRSKYGSPWMETAYGKFYVVYPDGKKSIKMYYKNAKTYASLFGGKVKEDF